MTLMARAGFDIRAAGPKDLSALMDLYRELQPDDAEMGAPLAHERFTQMLAHPGMKVFLAFSGERAVSTITLVIIPNLTRGGAPYAFDRECGHARGAPAARLLGCPDPAWS